MTPSAQIDPHTSALPYPESETDYHDQTHDRDGTTSLATRSQRETKPSSLLSFLSIISTSSPTRTANSLQSQHGNTTSTTGTNSTASIAHSLHTTPPSLSYDKTFASASNEDKNDDSIYEYEYESAVKPYQAPFYRRKKFWWTCTIVSLLSLAIFIPLLLIVIIPKVAQAVMNASTMQIQQMNMTNPQEASVHVSVAAAIVGIPSIFAATVEFQEPVQVYWVRGAAAAAGDQQPRVGQMSLGTIVKKAFAKAEFSQSTIFEIADAQLFGEFAKVMMASDTFLWRITASINVSVLGRTIKNLNLDKSLKLDGLSNFANLKIVSFDIPSDAPDGTGALVSIKVSIPNASPIGMSLGTLIIDMSLSSSTYLGRITAHNVTLNPGQPTLLQLDGTILRQMDPHALLELSDMISHYLANSPTTAYGQGVAAIMPDGAGGSRNVSWITAAIVATKMTIPLLPPTPMNVIKEVDIKEFNLVMTPEQPWAPIAASSGIGAVFQLPFNLSLNITDISDARLALAYDKTSIAEITTAVWNRSISDMTRNDIAFTLPASPLSIQPDAHDAFSKFLIAVTQQDTASFDILGSAQSAAITSLGQVNISVPFNTSLTVKGVNFAKMVPQLNGIVVASATVDYVVLNATVVIDNPSIFAVDAGPVTLHIDATLHGQTVYIGEVMISALKLSPGPNPLQAYVHFQPTDTAFRDAFFSEYIVGTDFSASIYGDAQSSPIASLAPIMQTLKMSTTVPGMKPVPQLIIGGNGNTTVGQFLNNHQVMLQVQILNPLATTLWIHTFSANVSWQGFPFGTIQVQQSFSIKPSGIDTSPLIAIQIPSSFQFWTFMISTFLPKNLGVLTGAMVYVDLTADIIATIDGSMNVGYEAGIKYSQNQVGVFLKIEFSLVGLGLGKTRRKRSLLSGAKDQGDDDSGEQLEWEDQLGPEPDRQDAIAYLAWLKHAVQLTYPTEAAGYRWHS
ncbi:hypothetical protein BGZ99_007224 [Dissophora globulifera]|uniref:Uncharacterized protein n=1 Tax=Dissophora globulifera TaxID=979702 RepID=A0A9P6UZM0_9FUNG|nr:hypothetical protein BGZ99_007224 [Dissophora globulifera]